MTLLGVLDGLPVDAVLAELELAPLVPARVEPLAPPTADELTILREQIDPARTVIGKA
jgi:hypothetical protein